MTVNESPLGKKRRPPTFKHLPLTRAIKLKQDWVLKQKIKSKWKEEKRKLQRTEPASLQNNTTQESESERSPAASPFSPVGSHSRSRHLIKSSRPDKDSVAPRHPQPGQNTTDSPNDALRERAREAYAPSSLHTYRANYSKVRGAPEKRQGKGQPNMKLRMNVMLEKIKREYA